MKKHTRLLEGLVLGFFGCLVALILLANMAEPVGFVAISPKGPYPGTVAANDLDFSWTAGANAADNTFTITGRNLLLIHNTNTASINAVTLDSVADSMNREADIVNYQIGANEYAAFWFGNTQGWRNATGEVIVYSSSSALDFAVITIPN